MKSDIKMIKELEQICLKTSEKGKYACVAAAQSLEPLMERKSVSTS